MAEVYLKTKNFLRFVLTAAHCGDVSFTFVRLGFTNINSSSETDKGMDYEIKKFIGHPNYDHRTSHHDIALVELKDKVALEREN